MIWSAARRSTRVPTERYSRTASAAKCRAHTKRRPPSTTTTPRPTRNGCFVCLTLSRSLETLAITHGCLRWVGLDRLDPLRFPRTTTTNAGIPDNLRYTTSVCLFGFGGKSPEANPCLTKYLDPASYDNICLISNVAIEPHANPSRTPSSTLNCKKMCRPMTTARRGTTSSSPSALLACAPAKRTL